MVLVRDVESGHSVLNHDRQIAWFFCILAALITLVCAIHGLGVDVDGVSYLSAGTNLADGHGLTTFGSPFTLFAPALPALVAVGVRLGTSAQTADLVLSLRFNPRA